MSAPQKITCPSCGFRNVAPLVGNRCVSCGAVVDDLTASGRQEGGEGAYHQSGFSVLWFGIAIRIMAVLTAAVVARLPSIMPAFDFEGSAGMLVAIPIWFVGGLLVGLISPGRTFVEPVLAAFLVALPTAFLLHEGQTVKVLPAFMYVLLSALGLLFALIGTYLGERIQVGPPTPPTA